MEVYGYVEGNVAADTLLIHPSGQCYGTVKTESAEIRGTLQGDVVVKHLISIRDTGSVSGNVQYGALAMEPGGNLTAEMRNVPPAVAGDLDITVDRGRSVAITLEDLHAVDPDDEAKDLVFTVSNARNGFVALSASPGRAAAKFTQADLDNVLSQTDNVPASQNPTTLDFLFAYTVAGHPLRVEVSDGVTNTVVCNATITIVQLIYSTAFQFGRYGLASAQAVVLFLMAVAVAVVQFRWLQTDVEY